MYHGKVLGDIVGAVERRRTPDVEEHLSRAYTHSPILHTARIARAGTVDGYGVEPYAGNNRRRILPGRPFHAAVANYGADYAKLFRRTPAKGGHSLGIGAESLVARAGIAVDLRLAFVPAVVHSRGAALPYYIEFS